MDIGEEASVQRYLFISGVVVGLAAAIAPVAPPLLVNAFKRSRQLRTAGQHEPVPADKPVPRRQNLRRPIGLQDLGE